MNDRIIFLRWVRTTWLGWLLGVPCIIVLALLGEAVGIGGSQVLVGAGMGTGLGLLQAREMRQFLGRFAPWMWSCVVGLSVPFLVADIAAVAAWNFVYWLPLCVALGGLIAGVWQTLLLRRRFRGTGWWIVGSAVGWSLAAGMAAMADALPRSQLLRGIWGALAYLGIVAAGGLILGVVTGLALAWLRRHELAV